MVKCSFCGEKIESGMGKMLVLKSGEKRYFCSKKCEKNWKIRRDPKKTRWTKIFMEKKK